MGSIAVVFYIGRVIRDRGEVEKGVLASGKEHNTCRRMECSGREAIYSARSERRSQMLTRLFLVSVGLGLQVLVDEFLSVEKFSQYTANRSIIINAKGSKENVL